MRTARVAAATYGNSSRDELSLIQLSVCQRDKPVRIPAKGSHEF
jgi:hypothetical protein